VDVRAITQDGPTLTITAADGQSWQARVVIITLPLMVLAAGHVALPGGAVALREAATLFQPASYEHAVLKAADAPWSTRSDEIVLSMASDGAAGDDHAALFAHMEGSALHYLDIVADEGRDLAALDEAGRTHAIRAKLSRHFGRAACDATQVLHVTNWAHDPFSRGAWALAKIGHAGARAILRQPMGPLFYAGEAASALQWGTVGGAWMEGERAAGQVAERLGGVSEV
jgi:monoamine oxidase